MVACFQILRLCVFAPVNTQFSKMNHFISQRKGFDTPNNSFFMHFLCKKEGSLSSQVLKPPVRQFLVIFLVLLLWKRGKNTRQRDNGLQRIVQTENWCSHEDNPTERRDCHYWYRFWHWQIPYRLPAGEDRSSQAYSCHQHWHLLRGRHNFPSYINLSRKLSPIIAVSTPKLSAIVAEISA